MLMREWDLARMGGQQRRTCFVQRKAPTAARYGDETHIACIHVESDLVE